MKQGVRRNGRGCTGSVRLRLTERELLCRRWSRGKHHRRLEVDLALRLGETRELEPALEELVRRRRCQRESASIPALELRQAPARSDLGLQNAEVTLGENDLRFDAFELRALRGDAE